MRSIFFTVNLLHPDLIKKCLFLKKHPNPPPKLPLAKPMGPWAQPEDPLAHSRFLLKKVGPRFTATFKKYAL
jgi:hypothetical protein